MGTNSFVRNLGDMFVRTCRILTLKNECSPFVLKIVPVCTLLVGKYVTGRRKRFRSYRVC